MENIIEIENLRFSYNTFEDEEPKEILKGIDLKVKKGEFLVILGHNGSGKSTLAKLINAQYLPKEGSIHVGGMDTREDDHLWDIKKTCGMVFQNPDNQMVTTVVEEDVAFGPENLNIPMPELKERVDKSLELVGMTEYRKASPENLSGGQKQRVAIAGILAMSPDCILLDEPTAMLDPEGRDSIMETLHRLNKEDGKTIVLITHFMDEAIDADRVLVMNEGQIFLEGSPLDVFSQVEKIWEVGLDVPQTTELAYYLSQEGFDIGTSILTIEDLCDVL